MGIYVSKRRWMSESAFGMIHTLRLTHHTVVSWFPNGTARFGFSRDHLFGAYDLRLGRLRFRRLDRGFAV